MDQVAGKYQIIKLLGEGCSGKVYLVEHKDISVRYALKILDNTLSDHQRFIERFKREAEVLLRFTHEGTIQLRDFGRTEDDHYYMAMDFCSGDVLKKLIQTHGNFTVEEALDIVIQLLSVLDAAHALGIIHRDIKPDNMMLVNNGQGSLTVKVLDFGIAKLRQTVELDSSGTMEGVSVGTPYYMSPEQASGDSDLDHRVDLYAAGVVLYELLSGAVPFKGKTVLQTLLMHLTHTAEPLEHKVGVPEFIDKLIEKSLQKNREDRFQSAKEFNAACQKALSDYREWMQSQTNKIKQAELRAASQSGIVNVRNDQPQQTRILCLDDNEMILNIMKHLLETQGYSAYTASNCSAIHDHLFHDDVRLLISDVEMPDMRGTKVCQMLKKTLPDLKIILFSNIDERELEKLSIESNADGWISKNSKPAEWLEKIKEHLKPTV